MGLYLLAGITGGGLIGAILGAGMEIWESGITSGASDVLDVFRKIMLSLMTGIATTWLVVMAVYLISCVKIRKEKLG